MGYDTIIKIQPARTHGPRTHIHVVVLDVNKSVVFDKSAIVDDAKTGSTRRWYINDAYNRIINMPRPTFITGTVSSSKVSSSGISVTYKFPAAGAGATKWKELMDKLKGVV
jgi:hypothetical protein